MDEASSRRIYDAKIARFLQADPFIQAATNTQSYNRYSYVLNNPLNATDPSGFLFKKLWNKVKPFVGAIVGVALVALTGGAASWFVASWYGAATAGAIAGAAGAAANGGNILKGAFTGGVAGAAFFGVGQYFRNLSKLNLDKLSKGGIGSLHSFGGNILTGGQIAGQIAAHAAVGGVMSVIQGGKFGHGFVSAGFTKGVTGSGLTEFGDSTGALVGETIAAAAVGGTVSEMTGGKFANGAQTAAFAYLFNQVATMFENNRMQAAQQSAQYKRAMNLKNEKNMAGIRAVGEIGNDLATSAKENITIKYGMEAAYGLGGTAQVTTNLNGSVGYETTYNTGVMFKPVGSIGGEVFSTGNIDGFFQAFELCAVGCISIETNYQDWSFGTSIGPAAGLHVQSGYKGSF